MPSEAEHLNLIGRYGAKNYAPLPVVIAWAEGSWVKDVHGKRYLDMLCAYSALNHGHRHPKLVQAMKEQLDRVAVTARAFCHDQLGPFFQELAEFCGMEMVLAMNSGAEAVETAVKLSRRWGYFKKDIPDNAAEIITCRNNFHGRTLSVISFSTEPAYRKGFGPFMPNFVSVPFGDARALAEAITPNTAAFLVEPIQGEGGIVVPPEDYLKEAARICKENKVLFVVDEIQTGLGRTGRHFAFENEDVRPDVLILGKALGGGLLPVSAVLSSRAVMEVFDPGSHGSTFGGNPLACAVARASLRVLVEENLAARAKELGRYAMKELHGMRSSAVKEVRGKGLLIGIELTPKAGNAQPYCEKLMEEGVLCKETHENVIRLAPPLTISREDLAWGLERVKKVLSAYA